LRPWLAGSEAGHGEMNRKAAQFLGFSRAKTQGPPRCAHKESEA